METTALKPYIVPDGEQVDPFDTRSTDLKASSLRPGHVLMTDDELGTPCFAIDHRVAATRGSGAIAFLAEDLEAGGWKRISVHANKTVKVLAR